MDGDKGGRVCSGEVGLSTAAEGSCKSGTSGKGEAFKSPAGFWSLFVAFRSPPTLGEGL